MLRLWMNQQAAEKGSECFERLMLRQRSAERKIPNDIKASPFVLVVVEGLRRGFQQLRVSRNTWFASV